MTKNLRPEEDKSIYALDGKQVSRVAQSKKDYFTELIQKCCSSRWLTFLPDENWENARVSVIPQNEALAEHFAESIQKCCSARWLSFLPDENWENARASVIPQNEALTKHTKNIVQLIIHLCLRYRIRRNDVGFRQFSKKILKVKKLPSHNKRTFTARHLYALYRMRDSDNRQRPRDPKDKLNKIGESLFLKKFPWISEMFQSGEIQTTSNPNQNPTGRSSSPNRNKDSSGDMNPKKIAYINRRKILQKLLKESLIKFGHMEQCNELNVAKSLNVGSNLSSSINCKIVDDPINYHKDEIKNRSSLTGDNKNSNLDGTLNSEGTAEKRSLDSSTKKGTSVNCNVKFTSDGKDFNKTNSILGAGNRSELHDETTTENEENFSVDPNRNHGSDLAVLGNQNELHKPTLVEDSITQEDTNDICKLVHIKDSNAWNKTGLVTEPAAVVKTKLVNQTTVGKIPDVFADTSDQNEHAPSRQNALNEQSFARRSVKESEINASCESNSMNENNVVNKANFVVEPVKPTNETAVKNTQDSSVKSNISSDHNDFTELAVSSKRHVVEKSVFSKRSSSKNENYLSLKRRFMNGEKVWNEADYMGNPIPVKKPKLGCETGVDMDINVNHVNIFSSVNKNVSNGDTNPNNEAWNNRHKILQKLMKGSLIKFGQMEQRNELNVESKLDSAHNCEIVKDPRIYRTDEIKSRSSLTGDNKNSNLDGTLNNEGIAKKQSLDSNTENGTSVNSNVIFTNDGKDLNKTNSMHSALNRSELHDETLIEKEANISVNPNRNYGSVLVAVDNQRELRKPTLVEYSSTESDTNNICKSVLIKDDNVRNKADFVIEPATGVKTKLVNQSTVGKIPDVSANASDQNEHALSGSTTVKESPLAKGSVKENEIRTSCESNSMNVNDAVNKAKFVVKPSSIQRVKFTNETTVENTQPSAVNSNSSSHHNDFTELAVSSKKHSVEKLIFSKCPSSENENSVSSKSSFMDDENVSNKTDFISKPRVKKMPKLGCETGFDMAAKVSVNTSALTAIHKSSFASKQHTEKKVTFVDGSNDENETDATSDKGRKVLNVFESVGKSDAIQRAPLMETKNEKVVKFFVLAGARNGSSQCAVSKDMSEVKQPNFEYNLNATKVICNPGLMNGGAVLDGRYFVHKSAYEKETVNPKSFPCKVNKPGVFKNKGLGKKPLIRCKLKPTNTLNGKTTCNNLTSRINSIFVTNPISIQEQNTSVPLKTGTADEQVTVSKTAITNESKCRPCVVSVKDIVEDIGKLISSEGLFVDPYRIQVPNYVNEMGFSSDTKFICKRIPGPKKGLNNNKKYLVIQKMHGDTKLKDKFKCLKLDGQSDGRSKKVKSHDVTKCYPHAKMLQEKSSSGTEVTKDKKANISTTEKTDRNKLKKKLCNRNKQKENKLNLTKRRTDNLLVLNTQNLVDRHSGDTVPTRDISELPSDQIITDIHVNNKRDIHAKAKTVNYSSFDESILATGKTDRNAFERTQNKSQKKESTKTIVTTQKEFLSDLQRKDEQEVRDILLKNSVTKVKYAESSYSKKKISGVGKTDCNAAHKKHNKSEKKEGTKTIVKAQKEFLSDLQKKDEQEVRNILLKNSITKDKLAKSSYSEEKISAVGKTDRNAVHKKHKSEKKENAKTIVKAQREFLGDLQKKDEQEVRNILFRNSITKDKDAKSPYSEEKISAVGKTDCSAVHKKHNKSERKENTKTIVKAQKKFLSYRQKKDEQEVRDILLKNSIAKDKDAKCSYFEEKISVASKTDRNDHKRRLFHSNTVNASKTNLTKKRKIDTVKNLSVTNPPSSKDCPGYRNVTEDGQEIESKDGTENEDIKKDDRLTDCNSKKRDQTVRNCALPPHKIKKTHIGTELRKKTEKEVGKELKCDLEIKEAREIGDILKKSTTVKEDNARHSSFMQNDLNFMNRLTSNKTNRAQKAKEIEEHIGCIRQSIEDGQEIESSNRTENEPLKRDELLTGCQSKEMVSGRQNSESSTNKVNEMDIRPEQEKIPHKEVRKQLGNFEIKSNQEIGDILNKNAAGKDVAAKHSNLMKDKLNLMSRLISNKTNRGETAKDPEIKKHLEHILQSVQYGQDIESSDRTESERLSSGEFLTDCQSKEVVPTGKNGESPPHNVDATDIGPERYEILHKEVGKELGGHEIKKSQEIGDILNKSTTCKDDTERQSNLMKDQQNLINRPISYKINRGEKAKDLEIKEHIRCIRQSVEDGREIERSGKTEIESLSRGELLTDCQSKKIVLTGSNSESPPHTVDGTDIGPERDKRPHKEDGEELGDHEIKEYQEIRDILYKSTTGKDDTSRRSNLMKNELNFMSRPISNKTNRGEAAKDLEIKKHLEHILQSVHYGQEIESSDRTGRESIKRSELLADCQSQEIVLTGRNSESSLNKVDEMDIAPEREISLFKKPGEEFISDLEIKKSQKIRDILNKSTTGKEDSARHSNLMQDELNLSRLISSKANLGEKAKDVEIKERLGCIPQSAEGGQKIESSDRTENEPLKRSELLADCQSQERVLTGRNSESSLNKVNEMNIAPERLISLFKKPGEELMSDLEIKKYLEARDIFNKITTGKEDSARHSNLMQDDLSVMSRPILNKTKTEELNIIEHLECIPQTVLGSAVDWNVARKKMKTISDPVVENNVERDEKSAILPMSPISNVSKKSLSTYKGSLNDKYLYLDVRVRNPFPFLLTGNTSSDDSVRSVKSECKLGTAPRPNANHRKYVSPTASGSSSDAAFDTNLAHKYRTIKRRLKNRLKLINKRGRERYRRLRSRKTKKRQRRELRDRELFLSDSSDDAYMASSESTKGKCLSNEENTDENSCEVIWEKTGETKNEFEEYAANENDPRTHLALPPVFPPRCAENKELPCPPTGTYFSPLHLPPGPRTPPVSPPRCEENEEETPYPPNGTYISPTHVAPGPRTPPVSPPRCAKKEESPSSQTGAYFPPLLLAPSPHTPLVFPPRCAEKKEQSPSSQTGAHFPPLLLAPSPRTPPVFPPRCAEKEEESPISQTGAYFPPLLLAPSPRTPPVFPPRCAENEEGSSCPHNGTYFPPLHLALGPRTPPVSPPRCAENEESSSRPTDTYFSILQSKALQDKLKRVMDMYGFEVVEAPPVRGCDNDGMDWRLPDDVATLEECHILSRKQEPDSKSAHVSAEKEDIVILKHGAGSLGNNIPLYTVTDSSDDECEPVKSQKKSGWSSPEGGETPSSSPDDDGTTAHDTWSSSWGRTGNIVLRRAPVNPGRKTLPDDAEGARIHKKRKKSKRHHLPRGTKRSC